MSDYLFDKSGRPDPDVEALELALAPLRYRGAPPPRPRPRLAWISAGVIVAAALVVLLVWRLTPRVAPGLPAVARWTIATRGTGATVDGAPAGTALPQGAWLETGDAEVHIEVADIGTATLGHARARLIATGPERHTLELVRGHLAAQVHAAPRVFVVQTPHVRAIDLGCAYTLDLDGQGVGLLHVTEGAVALAREGAAEVTVPAGASCGIGPDGAGLPWFDDATPAFRGALARYAQDPGALRDVLEAARGRDQLTLKALLDRSDGEARRQLAARLDELAHEGAKKGVGKKTIGAVKPPSHTGPIKKSDAASKKIEGKPLFEPGKTIPQ